MGAELVVGIAPAKLYVADLGKRAVVRISGRANCLSSVPFKRVINGLVERGRRAFTLDLSDCQLMDSTFLGVLVGLNRTLGQAGSAGGFSLYQQRNRFASFSTTWASSSCSARPIRLAKRELPNRWSRLQRWTKPISLAPAWMHIRPSSMPTRGTRPSSRRSPGSSRRI